MKIAIFRTDPQVQDLNSYNSQELGLANGLKAMGHSVDVYLTTNSSSNKAPNVELVEPGIRIIRMRYFLLPVLQEPVYRGVREQFRRERYDLVQINEEGNIATVLLVRVCASLGIKTVIYQGMYRVLSGRKWRYYEWFHHRIFRPYIQSRVSNIFCKTRRAQHFLDERGYRNTHTLPVGLDFSRFRDRVDQDWKARLGIKDEEQVVLYVGSLEGRRNPKFIVSLARAAGNNKKVLVVGEGPHQGEVELAANESGNGLIYLGRLSQKELPSLYEQSDVFILPSDYEIYGMVVIESLYFGTPVVSTRTAGPEDILETDNIGLILDDLDIEKWLSALDFFDRKASDGAACSERSRYAGNKFNWKNIAGRYLEVINQ